MQTYLVSVEEMAVRAEANDAAADWLESGAWTDDLRRQELGLAVAMRLRRAAANWREGVAERESKTARKRGV